MKRILCFLLLAVLAVSFCAPAMADISDAEKEARVAANVEAFKAMLDANGYKYTNEDNMFKLQFNIESSLETCKVWAFVYYDGIKVQADSPDAVPAAARNEMAQFIVRMNYQLRIGEFYMNYEDGLLGYEVFCYTEESVPTQESLDYALFIAVSMLEKYTDGIVAITDDGATAKEAYALFF